MDKRILKGLTLVMGGFALAMAGVWAAAIRAPFMAFGWHSAAAFMGGLAAVVLGVVALDKGVDRIVDALERRARYPRRPR